MGAGGTSSASTGAIIRADAAQAMRPDLHTLGVAGEKILSGILYEERNPRLQGLRAYATYTSMRFDPSGSALHKVYDMPIRSARWYVDPASDKPSHVEQADFIHDQLWEFGRQTFDDVMRLANLSLIYGFVPLEIEYDMIDQGPWQGKVGWANLAWRNPSTKWQWVIEELDGRRQFMGMVQKAPPAYEEKFIPANKLLLFVNDLEGENFDGWSMFRPCFKPWFYRDALYRIQAVGLERGFMGIPWAKLPQGYAADLRDLAKKIVESLRTDEQAGFVHPEDLEVGILSNKLEGAPMQHAIDHHTRMFWVAHLAQVLDLGSKAEGSFALASDQSDLLQMAINAPANRNADVLNLNPGIPQLLRFNFPDYDPTMIAKLSHGDIGQKNLERLGRVLAALGQFGFLTPDDATEDKLRQDLDLPERNEDYQNRSLWDLIQTVQPAMQDWRQRQEESMRLRPNTLVAPGTSLLGGGGPGTPTAAGGQRSPVGRGVKGTPAAAAGPGEFAEAAYQVWRSSQRWSRPHGRVTQDQRDAVKTTEDFAVLMSEMRAKARGIPERPSIRMAKLRRAYTVRMADEGGDFLATDTAPHGAGPLTAMKAEPLEKARAIQAAVKSGHIEENPDHHSHRNVQAQHAVSDYHAARIRDRLHQVHAAERPGGRRPIPEPTAGQPPVSVELHFADGAIRPPEPDTADLVLERKDGITTIRRVKR